MRIPSNIIWTSIGDFFRRWSGEKTKRNIEMLWQSMGQSASDALRYSNYYQKAQSPFSVDHWAAPAGLIKQSITKLDTSGEAAGRLIGYKGGYWYVVSSEGSVPQYGQMSVGDSSILYGPAITEELQHDELYLHKLYSTSSDALLTGTTSSTFTEFESIGTTDLPDVSWVNWAILQDPDTVNSAKDWSMHLRFKISRWDESPSQRWISFNSFGEYGPDFEARFEDDGTYINLKMGALAVTRGYNLTFSGSTITRTRGSWIGDGFHVGYNIDVVGTTSNNGSYVVTSVGPTTMTTSGSFTTEFSSSATVKNSLTSIYSSQSMRDDLISGGGELEMLIDYVASSSTFGATFYFGGVKEASTSRFSVRPGNRTISIDVLNQYKTISVEADFMEFSLDDSDVSIGDNFSYFYKTEAPLIYASTVCAEPFLLSPDAEIVSVSGSIISVEVAEEYFDYKPPMVKIETSSGWCKAKLLSDGTYSIIRRSSSGWEPSGEVKLTPYQVTPIEFISQSIFSSPEPLDMDEMWFFDSRLYELDIYNRYAKTLGMDQRDDSERYLNAVRGMQYGLMNSFSENHIKRALAMITSSPYAKVSGQIERVDQDRVRISGIIHDANRLYPVLPVGSYVNKFDPLIDGVNVYDWKNNHQLVIDRVGYWPSWGTFILQIPATVGLNEQSAYDVIQYVKRSKSIHNDFLIEYMADKSENIRDIHQKIENVVYSNVREDLTFDDHGEVAMSSLKFQVIGGENYGEEYQNDGDSTALDTGRTLDTGHALDPLRVIDPKYVDDVLFHSNDEVYLKTQGPAAKNPLKFNLEQRSWNQGPKPYSLLFLEDEAGSAISYSSSGWLDFTPAGLAVDLYDAEYMSSNLVFAVGEADTIYSSINGGKTWTQDVVNTPSTDDFTKISRTFALQPIEGIWSRDSSREWNKISTQGGTDIAFVSDLIGYIIYDSSGDSVFKKTTDGGVTWGSETSIVASKTPTTIHAYDEDNLIVTTTDGVYFSDDGGSSWTGEFVGTFTRFAIFNNAMDIIVSTNAAELKIIEDPFGTPSTSTISNPGGISTAVTGMAISNKGLYAITSSEIIKSEDDGATWADDSDFISGSIYAVSGNVCVGENIWRRV